MTDPSPFLSTIASSSAALVAIIGGLLVARFVTLDSEQEGAQHLVNEAVEQLETARRREQDARDDLLRREVRDFCSMRILHRIHEGERDTSELREEAGYTSLSDEQIEKIVSSLASDFENAEKTLKPLIEAASGKSRLGTWENFKRQHDELEIQDERVWSIVYADLRTPPAPATPFNSLGLGVGYIGTPTPSALVALDAQRYDALRDEVDRAARQVEDLEAEVKRRELARDRIGRPKGLLAGLIVLGIFTVGGVIYPIWLMGHAPKDLTRSISHPVFIVFVVGLVVLLGYMGWLALRLSGWFKRAKTDTGNQSDN